MHGNLPTTCAICHQENRAEDPDSRLQSSLKKIIQYDDIEFREKLAKFCEGTEPHAASFSGEGGARVELVGTMHSNDPESAMIKGVKDRVVAYLDATPVEEALLMIEGMHGGLSRETLDATLAGVSSEAEAIQKFGEPGLLMWTAKEKGIEITSPEAPDNEIIADLSKDGRDNQDIAMSLLVRELTSSIGQEKAKLPDDVALYFARMFSHIENLTNPGWISAETKKEIETAVAAKDMGTLSELALKIIEEFTQGANERFQTYPSVAGKKLFPSVGGLLKRNRGVPEDQQVALDDVNKLSDPVSGSDAPTNQILKVWNQKRDEYIVRQVDDAMRRGKKPLVVYGATHTFAIAPAVESLVTL